MIFIAYRKSGKERGKRRKRGSEIGLDIGQWTRNHGVSLGNEVIT